MMAAMEMTEETPMTIPSTVSAERTLDECSVCMAAAKFSAGLGQGHERHQSDLI
jgi:hypothetical protein